VTFAVVFFDHVFLVTDVYSATLPGMWDRTVTIGSAGKTFSVTGWKLGWSIGPKHLIRSLCMVHQNCNYTCPTPLQVITCPSRASASGILISGFSACFVTK